MSLINKQILPFTPQPYHPKKHHFKQLTQQHFKPSWNLLSFYPPHFSFLSPTQLQHLQNQYPKLQQLGVNLYSLSTHTHFLHKPSHHHSHPITKLQYTIIPHPSQTIT
ncbi:redoxin domain-containing protein, partial [Staphylococcus epidermidis]|uniref:redoxin domain-containing protein n=1 Tax=Staphylococcus epidermidis TaxID=1282 RepID=UPI0011A2B24F